jgi:UDP-N-acetyl-D-mannosaminuronate dehydrogenase
MQVNNQLNLKDAILEHKALVSVIGLGYVGLPLVIAFSKVGFPVLGFDIDDEKVSDLNKGKSYPTHSLKGNKNTTQWKAIYGNIGFLSIKKAGCHHRLRADTT